MVTNSDWSKRLGLTKADRKEPVRTVIFLGDSIYDRGQHFTVRPTHRGLETGALYAGRLRKKIDELLQQDDLPDTVALVWDGETVDRK